MLKANDDISKKKLEELKACKKIYSYMGLSAKARQIASGEFSTEKAVKTGTACLVIVALDASDNTKKMFKNMCTYYNVPLYFFGSKVRLGQAIGKQFRASLAFLDNGLAEATCKQLKIVNGTGGSN